MSLRHMTVKHMIISDIHMPNKHVSVSDMTKKQLSMSGSHMTMKHVLMNDDNLDVVGMQSCLVIREPSTTKRRSAAH